MCKQPAYRLERILINHFERTGTVRCTGIIAQIDIVVLRQLAGKFFKNSQPPVTGVENANRLGPALEQCDDVSNRIGDKFIPASGDGGDPCA